MPTFAPLSPQIPPTMNDNLPPLLTELTYLGPVSHYARMLAHGSVALEAHEHYVKRSYRNRVRLLTANGPMTLSIPLARGKNSQQPIKEVAIAYTEDWAAQHWRTIVSAYGRAPFFEHYAEELEALYRAPVPLLWDWNRRLMDWALGALQLDVGVAETTAYERTTEAYRDGRHVILPNRPTRLPGWQPQAYPQVFEDRYGYVEDLSVLDLVLCCGPYGATVLRQSWVLD